MPFADESMFLLGFDVCVGRKRRRKERGRGKRGNVEEEEKKKRRMMIMTWRNRRKKRNNGGGSAETSKKWRQMEDEVVEAVWGTDNAQGNDRNRREPEAVVRI